MKFLQEEIQQHQWSSINEKNLKKMKKKRKKEKGMKKKRNKGKGMKKKRNKERNKKTHWAPTGGGVRLLLTVSLLSGCAMRAIFVPPPLHSTSRFAPFGD